MKMGVFLVEDEIVARESMRENFPWDESGFTLIGEAPDGEAALPLILESRPDIVITDVRMPFMDGLQLAQALKKLTPLIRVIFISGHDEFIYAKQALSVSAVDYLLKPVSPADLLTALRKTAESIESEMIFRARVEELERSSVDGKRAIAERFLLDMASGSVPMAEIVSRAAEFGIDIVARYYCAAIVAIERKDSGAKDDYAEGVLVEKRAREYLDSNGDCIAFRRCLTELYVLFKGDDPGRIQSAAESTLEALRIEVERQSRSTISAGVGGVHERLQGVPRSIREAEVARSYTFMFGPGRVVLLEEAERLAGGAIRDRPGGVGGLARCLREGSLAEVNTLSAAFEEQIESPAFRGLPRDYALADLVISAASLVGELGGDPGTTVPGLKEAEEVLRSGDRNRMRGFIAEICRKTLEFRENRRADKYGDILRRARRTIEEAYSDPDLSLTRVASEVGMSPSHFSAVFSKETGATFSDTLAKARMDRAKVLLRTTSLRSSEISTAVGFRDPHYFSYAFKRREGQTPQEYRNASGANA